MNDARSLAAQRMFDLGDRWAHVQAVAHAAEALVSRKGVAEVVACAAWLHDIGYAASVATSDFHPLDGARLLVDLGAPAEVVSLVAYHSGAEYEAEERGLGDELRRFSRPTQANLDALILVDMTTSPAGQPVSVEDRLSEILTRYPANHPVHRAVTRSRAYLSECATRAAKRLASTDEGARPAF
jgi:putative nucleotidyltransferase with HDIG domain